MTEGEIIGWHHRLNVHELEQTLGVGGGQGSLTCCSPWGHKESDTTDWLTELNWTELNWGIWPSLLSSRLLYQSCWCNTFTWMAKRNLKLNDDFLFSLSQVTAPFPPFFVSLFKNRSQHWSLSLLSICNVSVNPVSSTFEIYPKLNNFLLSLSLRPWPKPSSSLTWNNIIAYNFFCNFHLYLAKYKYLQTYQSDSVQRIQIRSCWVQILWCFPISFRIKV